MNSDVRSTLVAICCGGLIAGTVDIGAASLIGWLSPVVILQAIASGLLGAASFHGGAVTAVVGLLLQWAMSLIIAALYVFASRDLPVLVRYWSPAGILYGAGIYVVMNYVVVPLSAAPFRGHPFTLTKTVENLLAMLLFGLIIAFCTRYFSVVGVSGARKVR